jgi:hypothetical protein
MFFMYESGGEWYVKKDDKGKQWEYGLIAHRGCGGGKDMTFDKYFQHALVSWAKFENNITN